MKRRSVQSHGCCGIGLSRSFLGCDVDKPLVARSEDDLLGVHSLTGTFACSLYCSPTLFCCAGPRPHPRVSSHPHSVIRSPAPSPNTSPWTCGSSSGISSTHAACPPPCSQSFLSMVRYRRTQSLVSGTKTLVAGIDFCPTCTTSCSKSSATLWEHINGVPIIML